MHLVNVFSYFRYSVPKTGEYVKELSLSFLLMKTELKKLLLVGFLFLLLFSLIVKKLRFLFGPHCNISAYTQDYELKYKIERNFDTLISDLKSYFQYEIAMTSL